MANFNVTIPDSKIGFFKELLASLNFTVTETAQENELSPEHKKILDQRLDEYEKNPDSYLSWEEVKKDLESRI